MPDYSQLCHSFRPLFKMNTKFIWNIELDTHSQHIKNQLANATKITRYGPHLETRIKCDASRAGSGAAVELRLPTRWQRGAFKSQVFNTNQRYSVALEHPSQTGWQKIAFASCDLHSNEERYSGNELECLGGSLVSKIF